MDTGLSRVFIPVGPLPSAVGFYGGSLAAGVRGASRAVDDEGAPVESRLLFCLDAPLLYMLIQHKTPTAYSNTKQESWSRSYFLLGNL